MPAKEVVGNAEIEVATQYFHDVPNDRYPALQIEASEDECRPDGFPAHARRDAAGALVVTDESAGLFLLGLDETLGFTLIELGVEEMNIRLVSGGTPFEEPCRVELVQAIAESSFDVHFTLDGARHVNAVKEH